MINIDEKPKVKLIGLDENAFAIIGFCHKAWKKENLPENEWIQIREEMMSGDYDHLLQTAMKYFDIQ